MISGRKTYGDEEDGDENRRKFSGMFASWGTVTELHVQEMGGKKRLRFQQLADGYSCSFLKKKFSKIILKIYTCNDLVAN